MNKSLSQQSPLKTLVIIPAAGKGQRMGGDNKLLLPLLGRPILTHTIEAFQGNPLVTSITLALSEDTARFCDKYIKDRPEFNKVRGFVQGGATRQASVFNALTKSSPDYEIVLVHDGARPLIDNSIISAAIDSAARHGAAVPVVEVKDTIKEVSNGLITNTPLRSSLRAVQTPQSFRRDVLLRAFEAAIKSDFTGTDEASLVERLNLPVSLFPGSYENIKITTPEDMLIAQSILRKRALNKDGEKTAASAKNTKKEIG